MKKKILLSIDFEDVYHDFLSSLNGKKNIKINEQAIYESYIEINKIIINKFANKKITFFCTGVLAEKFPDMVNQISKDGHEVACHHYFHDSANGKSLYQFEKEIETGISKIYKACRIKPIGYRSPFFSINNNIKLYKVIKKYFNYDSSYLYLNNQKLPDNIMDKNFKIIKVYNEKFFFFQIRTGGSFFRVLSENKIIDLLNTSHKKNLIPQIYLHPYDIKSNSKFLVKISEINKKSFFLKLFYYTKQFQWHYLNNHSVEKKLKNISKKFQLIGTIKDNLKIF